MSMDYDGWDDDDEPEECYECWGEGTYIACCDDLCHGQGYCIHGDEAVCPVCKGSGVLP